MTFAEIQDALKKISKWPWQRYEDAVDIGVGPSTRQTLYFNKLEDAIFFQQSPQIISDLLTRLIKAEAEMQRRCAEAALSFIKKGGDPEQIAQAIKGLK